MKNMTVSVSLPQKRKGKALAAVMAVSLLALTVGGKSHGAGPFTPATAAASPVKNNSRQKASGFLDALYAKLAELQTRPADITYPGKTPEPPGIKDTVVCISARMPMGRPIEWTAWDIAKAAEGTSYSLSDCLFDEKKRLSTFVFSSSDKKAPRVRLCVSRSERYMSGTGSLALVGEIAGDTTYKTIVDFLSLPAQLSISLVPGKQQSALVAQLAGHYRKEVVIRLPLEPASKIPSDFPAPVIMVHYSKDLVRSMLSQAMKTIPNYSGFSNLWGSRALEDSRIMTIILDEIKKERGYFIEIMSTKNSLAGSLAENSEVPYREMAAMIGRDLKQADIEKQLRAYAATAQTNGVALVSCEISGPFIGAVRALLPWFKQNGISLVFPSKIVKTEKFAP
jgi:polysaccharide deacetylase 2 family uncharacterized protein YibQ